jgi:(2Fe-2S) ferredoxin
VLAADNTFTWPSADESRYRVHICFGPNCTNRGSRALLSILEQAVRDAGLGNDVEVIATTCRNRCDEGPSLNVYPGPVFYNRIDREAIREIVDEHLAAGMIASRWLYCPKIGSRSPR